MTQLSRGRLCSHMLPAAPHAAAQDRRRLWLLPESTGMAAHVPHSSKQGQVPAAPVLSSGKIEAEKPLATIRTTQLPSPSPVGAVLWCPRDILQCLYGGGFYSLIHISLLHCSLLLWVGNHSPFWGAVRSSESSMLLHCQLLLLLLSILIVSVML